MFDRQYVNTPYRAPKSYGRNEKVTITNGTDTKELKYKKAEILLEGEWTLVEV